MDKTALILLHYGNIQLSLDFLKSIKNINDESQKIFVVDNSTVDNSRTLKSVYNDFLYIKSDTNKGFAGGVNLGLKMALRENYRDFIIVNNDVILSQNCLRSIIEYSRSKKKLGIASPKIYFAPGFEFHKKRYKIEDLGKVIWYAGGRLDWNNVYAGHIGVDEVDHGQYDFITETDFATGCLMYVKREVIDKIGLFDERYFLYLEDVDYSLRAKNAGFEVIYCPKAFIWHKNAVSSKGAGSNLHVYYQTRNRLYFGMKYAGLRAKKSLFAESTKFLFHDRVRRKAVFDYYLGHMGKADV